MQDGDRAGKAEEPYRVDLKALRSQFERSQINAGHTGKEPPTPSRSPSSTSDGIRQRIGSDARPPSSDTKPGTWPSTNTKDPQVDPPSRLQPSAPAPNSVPRNERSAPPAPAPKPLSSTSVLPQDESKILSSVDSSAGGRPAGAPPRINRATRPNSSAEPTKVHNKVSIPPPPGSKPDQPRSGVLDNPFQSPPRDPFEDSAIPASGFASPSVQATLEPSLHVQDRRPPLRQASKGPPIPSRPETSLTASAEANASQARLSVQRLPPPQHEGGRPKTRPPLPKRSSDVSTKAPGNGLAKSSPLHNNGQEATKPKESPGRFAPPPQRSAVAKADIVPVRPISSTQNADSDSEDEAAAKKAAINSSMPDITRANRQRPVLPQDIRIHHGQPLSAFAFGGQHIVTSYHSTRIWYMGSISTPRTVSALPEVRATAINFKASSGLDPSDDSRYVWLGFKDGALCEVDLLAGSITQRRYNVHSAGIDHIFRVGKSMLTLDESGKLQIWIPQPSGEISLLGKPRPYRLQDRSTFALLAGEELWVASAYQTHGKSLATLRAPSLKIFQPFSESNFQISPVALTIDPVICPMHIGAIISGTTVPTRPDVVFFGHDDGMLSVWSVSSKSCLKVMRLSYSAITCMASVTSLIWVGFRNGMIYIYDPQIEPWIVRKMWKAHEETVIDIIVDEDSAKRSGQLQVATGGAGGVVHIWDGLLMEDWYLTQLQDREGSYCDYRYLSVAICTWNIDATSPQQLIGTVANHEMFSTFLKSVDSPDIIVFGFQEVIDLENKALTAKSLLMGKKKGLDAKSSGSTISANYALWVSRISTAVKSYLPDDYTVTHKEDLVGLLSVVLIKTNEKASLRRVAVNTVKTGLGGLYGNKGSIVSRLTIDDTSICFLNNHLAAGQRHLRQRNNDVAEILGDNALFPETVSLSREAPYEFVKGGDGSMILDHEICFFAGDLNYRIDQARSIVLQRATQGLPGWQALQESDQLLKEMKVNPSFRLTFFKEPAIEFAPTYKYNPHSDDYDTSEKLRIPAYCDRILYKGGPERVKPLLYTRLEANISDHKPVIGIYQIRVKKSDAKRKAQTIAELEKIWPQVRENQLKQALLFYDI